MKNRDKQPQFFDKHLSKTRKIEFQILMRSDALWYSDHSSGTSLNSGEKNGLWKLIDDAIENDFTHDDRIPPFKNMVFSLSISACMAISTQPITNFAQVGTDLQQIC